MSPRTSGFVTSILFYSICSSDCTGSLEQSRLRVFRRGSAHGDCSSLTVVSTRLHQLGCRILNQMWRFSNHQSRCRYSCSARGPQSPIHYVPQQGHSFRPSHALCSPPLCLRGTPHSSFPVQSEERWVRSYHTQSSPMLFRDGNNMESECWTCYESVKFQPWGRLVISLIRVTLRHESCPASHGLESRTLIYGAAVGNCRSGSEEAVVLIMTLPRRRNFAISTSQLGTQHFNYELP
ncbi:hypothetical protein BDN71DRAFT_590663 [Pleurotus eryngii]|uniref:Uncharacterized protein n=1 Tax=Pleurotus eryngii TaxID=5323 RepID=A0A9P6A2B9_PLEER|nr:hypothetical protein BDN71DRAFT_590663 [Pleurotus eryngii]